MLTRQQEEIILGYYLGLTSENESEQAKILISTDKNAVKFYRKCKADLSPLEILRPMHCPDYLVERTISACLSKHTLEEENKKH